MICSVSGPVRLSTKETWGWLFKLCNEAQARVESRMIIGELLAREANTTSVSMTNAACVVKELRMESDGLYATVELLETPCGKLAASVGILADLFPRIIGTSEADARIVAIDLVLRGVQKL